MAKNWRIIAFDSEAAGKLADELGVSQLVAGLLVNRGFVDAEDATVFLNPSLQNLYDPFLLDGMEEATLRLATALDNKERIAVFGDYDVDGITSTSLLTLFFREIGYPVRPYLPNRLTDGYGLNPDAIMAMARDDIKLLVTVDCGISAVAEAKLAAECGIDLIITDHHEVPDEKPQACAIIDPKMPGSQFPFHELAGVGVALYLLIGLRRKLCDLGKLTPKSMPNLRRYLDLVALGTVSDLVPLVDHNRIFVHYGLKEIAKESRMGIRALREVVGVGDREVTSTLLGYLVGPRINAAGRLGDPTLALDLLISDDDSVTFTIARELDRLNYERQRLERAILERAEEMIRAEALDDAPALVIGGEDWHPGVIGIVASRLVERHHKPAVVIGFKDGIGRGSARGLPGFDLYSIIGSTKHCLIQYGGHQMAAGLLIKQDRFDEFAKNFIEQAAKVEIDEAEHYLLEIDGLVTLGQVDHDLIEALKTLAPYGIGNPEPVLCARDVTVISAREVGSGHLKMFLGDETGTVDAIGFDMAHRSPKKNDRIDVAFYPQINRWQGNETIQLRLKDFKD
jgi:single-stranded-DNA-specific exonuclease